MSFEIIDNSIQVGLLLIAGVACLVEGFRTQDRRFWILSGFYTSISMGTLYYLLYLVIWGVVPQIFYVSEIAWTAAYLFLLAFCLIETQKYRKKVDIPVCLLTAVEAVTVIGWQIPCPSCLFSAVFAAVTAMIFYYAVVDFRNEKRKLTFFMAILIVLQLMLYIVSAFMNDFTQFNLYFAVDLLLMSTMCSLFFFLKKEQNR